MRNIGFITKNKVLAQSLAVRLRESPDLGYELFLLNKPGQVLLEAEMLKIDLSIIEVTAESHQGHVSTVSLCEGLRRATSGCRIVLLITKADIVSRDVAVDAKKRGIVDDFVFTDESLQYLLANLSSL